MLKMWFRSFKMFYIVINIRLISSIQINSIKVPNAVKNNSGTPVTLDCDYTVRPDDTELVVKWLLNNEVVYQWIPSQKPQSLGFLKTRVDLSYKATDDPKTVFSSLKILNPTTEIAGEYKCFVSTFADEDFSSKNMVIFEPEHSLVIIKEEPKGDHINFTCFASEVYPAPKLILYKEKSSQRNPIQILEWNTSKHPNGRFSVFILATSPVEALEPGSLIYCELRIPGTGYVKKKSLLYYPSKTQKDCGNSNCIHANLLLLFAAIVVLH